jgi:trehalose 6-phosphate phosphatase
LQHLFSPEGKAALAAAMRLRPLLAFDFDGTLAPIVSHPDDARIPPEVAERLQRLARLLPVAIVTGRSIADVRVRLGFEPHFVVGNHGAEVGFDAAEETQRARRLEPLRQRIAAHRAELAALGVYVEDKGQSMALHYRQARPRQRARSLIQELLAPRDESLRTFSGKMVENVVAADSPDKAEAVQALLARSGARSVVFAGDDVNDEPVFVAAPPDWLTVRIGRDVENSRARFFLDGPAQVSAWLQAMLGLLVPDRG